MMMLIPISVTTPGKGQRFFPRKLRGKLLPEREAKAIWQQVMADRGRTKASKRPSRRKA